MKKIINAKLKEAKQFNSTILENIKEAIPISNIILANQKKATNSFKQSKKSFLNVQNSSNETKTSIDEFIKANNDYNANPTEEKLKLINEKRSSLLYKINLNSNNSKIFSSDLLISKNDMLESIEKIKEILPTLKKVEVNINKLNLTYLKINQLMKIKKTIKNLNNQKPKQITRPIFRVDPPEKPKCDEVRLLLLVEEAFLDGKIEELKKIKNYDIFEKYYKSISEKAALKDKIRDIEKEVEEIQDKDQNSKVIKDLKKEIKTLTEDVLPIRNNLEWRTVQERLDDEIKEFNELNKYLATVIKSDDANYIKKETERITSRSNVLMWAIDRNIGLIKKYGPVSKDNIQLIKDLWEFTGVLEEMIPNYTDTTVKLTRDKLNEISELKLEIEDYDKYIKSNSGTVSDFENDNKKLLNDIRISNNNIRFLNRLLDPLLLLCDETTPTPV
jgi:hypothetical protein